MKTFSARWMRGLFMDRLYRVCLIDGRAYFIQIGGTNPNMAGAHFGLLGILIAWLVTSRSRARYKEIASQLEVQHPSAMLSAGKNNFCVGAAEFETSTLKGRSFLGGARFGFWTVKLRDRKAMNFQMESMDEMKRAFEALPQFLSQHVNEVAWNADKNKFVKAAAAA